MKQYTFYDFHKNVTFYTYQQCLLIQRTCVSLFKKNYIKTECWNLLKASSIAISLLNFFIYDALIFCIKFLLSCFCCILINTQNESLNFLLQVFVCMLINTHQHLLFIFCKPLEQSTFRISKTILKHADNSNIFIYVEILATLMCILLSFVINITNLTVRYIFLQNLVIVILSNCSKMCSYIKKQQIDEDFEIITLEQEKIEFDDPTIQLNNQHNQDEHTYPIITRCELQNGVQFDLQLNNEYFKS